MRLLLIFLLLCIACMGRAQKISDLSPEQLKEELGLLEQALAKYNPAMYAYNSKAAFHQRIVEIQKTIIEPIGAIHYFKLLCWAVAGANEAHLTVGSQKDAFYKGFFGDEYKSLPLGVRYIGDKIYVWRNFSSDSTLEQGDEILSINGHSAAAIRQQIFKYTASDGAIETSKQNRLSKELSARYFWFIEQPDFFTVEYRKKGSEQSQELELAALSRPEMSKWSIRRGYKTDQPKGIAKFYNFYINNGVAHLILRSFDEEIAKENDIKAYTFYERIFKRLRQNKIKNLVIDVRDNIGGMKEFGDDMLPFVLKKNRKGIYRELISWNGEKVEAAFPKRSRWAFKGDLYILVNGGTFSTAAHIAKYLREFAEATTIGEETGSRYEGFAAGNYHHYFLPYSQIRIGIPNKWVKNIISEKQQTKNRGLIPDYPITLSIDDMMEGRDRVREKAEELIKLKE